MEATNQTALCYYMPIPKLVQLSKEKSYYFDTRHSVSLAWVDNADVQTMLNVKGGCCGGQRQVIFRANENQIKVWSTGGY